MCCNFSCTGSLRLWKRMGRLNNRLALDVNEIAARWMLICIHMSRNRTVTHILDTFILILACLTEEFILLFR